MYSDKKNILQLVALLKESGITNIVLCPGSRNAPIVHSFVADSDFTCYSMTDERSAGFFALGLTLSEDIPTAVCCTSGSALLNLHPAVAEAFYQKLPLIVISADRPGAWIGQMDGQTLPQSGVFQTLTKKSVNLPEVHTDEDEWYCNRLLNEAILELDHHGRGPVHINIPISEPLFQFTVESLPKVRKINRLNGDELSELCYYPLTDQIKKYTKKMMIIGQTMDSFPFCWEEQELLLKQFACLSEHLDNSLVSDILIKNFDTILYSMPKELMREMAPELLITYGGHIVSKRLKKFLRQHPPKEHWHISVDGEVADLYCSLTTIIEMEPEDFLAEMSCRIEDVELEYPGTWKDYSQTISEPDLAYSEMSAIGALIKRLPDTAVLHLANSSVVRYAQLYSLPPTIPVYCNRGTSGIEGSLSTAIGYAARSEKVNFIAIGDLSFFYDMNALWSTNVRPNLRILLLNNGGGEIFNTLPGLDSSTTSHKFISAVHHTSAKGWAEERGFIYQKVENDEQLREAMRTFTQSELTVHPIIMEVFTDKDEDTRILKEYYHQLKQK